MNRALGSLLGAASFGVLAWWLHPHWVMYPLALLAFINLLVLMYRMSTHPSQ